MNALEQIIREIIAADGPISLARYMELALQHPDYGYYRVREPIGRAGDFITAPEISQMFGEMIGVWVVEQWRALRQPDAFALLELGPGQGALLRDLLRATARVSGFHAAMKICLHESNQILRKRQCEKLEGFELSYIDDLSHLPSRLLIIIANEFFDALPARQFENTAHGWVERMVMVKENGLALTQRALSAAESKLILRAHGDAGRGVVIEQSPAAQSIMRLLSKHIARYGGAMLAIDYGYAKPSGKATLQALSNHNYANILERPGEVDLSAHVDFSALARIATQAGAEVEPVIGQGEFLKHTGLEIRAASLKQRATPEQAAEIDSALHRLTAPEHMGELFKVLRQRCFGTARAAA